MFQWEASVGGDSAVFRRECRQCPLISLLFSAEAPGDETFHFLSLIKFEAANRTWRKLIHELLNAAAAAGLVAAGDEHLRRRMAIADWAHSALEARGCAASRLHLWRWGGDVGGGGGGGGGGAGAGASLVGDSCSGHQR
jgi:hypothetical protein